MPRPQPGCEPLKDYAVRMGFGPGESCTPAAEVASKGSSAGYGQTTVVHSQ